MKNKVTMQNIADELGVSKSLVSKALSNSYGVSNDMKNMVRLKAMEIGYKQERYYKSKTYHLDNYTIIIERSDLLESEYWNLIVGSIEREIENRQKSVFLSIIENGEVDIMPSSIKYLKSSGIFVLGITSLKHISQLNSSGIPIVLVDSYYSNLKFDHVLANNYHAGYEATEFIIKHGHREIGFVGSPMFAYSFRDRLRGFMDCIENYEELKITPCYITGSYEDIKKPFPIDQFKRIMTQPEYPTALFCANDPIAYSIYEILNEIGLRIPEDISVMGVDNLKKCDWVQPKLTTINISKEQMGKRAVELMENRINEPYREFELILIGTNVIKRESVKSIL